jgi:hypothetical protein
MNPTSLHCYRPERVSDCDTTLESKLRASLRLFRKARAIATAGRTRRETRDEIRHAMRTTR